MQRKPIIYEEQVEVRFDDLDSYGHVNSSRYLDFVVSSRWKFAQTHLNYSVQSLTNRGVGVYLTRSLVAYRRAINGLQKLWVQSYVSNIKANSIAVISFKITDLSQETLYADGEIDFTVIDFNTQKPIVLTDWLLDYLFHPETQQ